MDTKQILISPEQVQQFQALAQALAALSAQAQPPNSAAVAEGSTPADAPRATAPVDTPARQSTVAEPIEEPDFAAVFGVKKASGWPLSINRHASPNLLCSRPAAIV